MPSQKFMDGGYSFYIQALVSCQSMEKWPRAQNEPWAQKTGKSLYKPENLACFLERF